jgi:hypothetical protein
MNFLKHENFCLENFASFWGSAQIQDIINLLDSVITNFYSILDDSKINSLPVLVLRSSSKPMMIKRRDFVLIYLNVEERLWSKYAYQFSHELCHYIIDTDFPPKNDRFGWLEETLCELASFYTLNKMSITWQTDPPYPNWKDYSVSLKEYVDEIVSRPENNISTPFSTWLTNNLPELFNNRYKRTENTIIAIHLLPIFTRIPDLWKTIHFIKNIVITDNMNMEEYLLEWKKFIPYNLYSNFDIFVTQLLCN